MVEELGEVSRVRKQFLRDKQDLDVNALKHEMVDLFVYLMQACMALDMNLQEEYMRKMEESEERFHVKAKWGHVKRFCGETDLLLGLH